MQLKPMLWAAALSATALALAAPAAHATIYKLKFTGTVTGTDTLGLFGPAGANLNTTYVADYLIDSTKGLGLMPAYNRGQGIYDDVGGLGPPSPLIPVTANLLINGHSVFVGSSPISGGAAVFGDPTQPFIKGGARAAVEDLFPATGLYVQVSNALNSLDDPFAFPATFGEAFYVSSKGIDTLASGQFEVGTFTQRLETLEFGFNGSVTIPEPKTWATMLVGLIGVGTILRRRRRRSQLQHQPI